VNTGPFPAPPRSRRHLARRRRGGVVLRILLGLLVLGAIFVAGVALGEALHDNPTPGGTRTGIRTLRPLPLPPERRTVTVTTTPR
jgi:hypothetical protein